MLEGNIFNAILLRYYLQDKATEAWDLGSDDAAELQAKVNKLDAEIMAYLKVGDADAS